MIVSASYRTDIPAFYGEWFAERLSAGYCKTFNAFSRRVSVVPLTRDAVDGFVFWTKNVKPFLPTLDLVANLGIPFMIQHTVTGYPRSLEPAVIRPSRVLDAIAEVQDRFGAGRLVWRYDPILLTSVTDFDFHRENFAKLCGLMEGLCDEVAVSFTQWYRKTQRNVQAAGEHRGFAFWDPPDGDKRAFLSELSDVGQRHGIRLSVCSQPALVTPGSAPASCVDAARLTRVGGKPLTAPAQGNRPGCLCAKSVDIGAYDTCPHGCVYCYAVETQGAAKAAYRAHDPHGEFLFPPIGPTVEEPVKKQQQLF